MAWLSFFPFVLCPLLPRLTREKDFLRRKKISSFVRQNLQQLVSSLLTRSRVKGLGDIDWALLGKSTLPWYALLFHYMFIFY